MELKLFIHDKDVDFTIGAQKGHGLEELVKEADKGIDKIIIEGETKSYSFLRQICLFVNLLVSAKKTAVELKSSSFIYKEEILVPVYE